MRLVVATACLASGHTKGVSTTVSLVELVAPLRADPAHTAILLDVDGTLAPIITEAGDVALADSTRDYLQAVAKKYRLVACVSGRRAAEAKRIVAIGELAYIGNHGIERLDRDSWDLQLSDEIGLWGQRVQEFTASQQSRDLERLGVRFEDKAVITALHWRGAADEEAAQAAVSAIADSAQDAGLATHWGRKVLEIRPPLNFDKGSAIEDLLRDSDVYNALYAGDDSTDLDAFAALTRMADSAQLRTAVRVGVRSQEGPALIAEASDFVLQSQQEIDLLLSALVGREE